MDADDGNKTGYCILDDTTVIFGPMEGFSINNHLKEPIIISENDANLADSYIQAFQKLIAEDIENTNEFSQPDYMKIIKRLEMIKSFAVLEEEEDLSGQIRKLKKLHLPAEVQSIIALLEYKRFTAAFQMLDEYLQSMRSLYLQQDAEKFALQLEIRSLEDQVAGLNNDLIEVEKLVHDFMVRHMRELGELIIQLLQLKKMNASGKAERWKAEEDEKRYREGFEANNILLIPELSAEEKKQIKELYREASMLCHPDRFSSESEELQKQAEEVFKELASAYNNNDIERVKEILGLLKNGRLKLDRKAHLHLDALRARIAVLRNKIKDMLRRLNEVKETEAYRTASENSDWNAYFAEAKANLKDQIKSYQNNVKHG
jgi:hypothetical protein